MAEPSGNVATDKIPSLKERIILTILFLCASITASVITRARRHGAERKRGMADKYLEALRALIGNGMDAEAVHSDSIARGAMIHALRVAAAPLKELPRLSDRPEVTQGQRAAVAFIETAIGALING